MARLRAAARQSAAERSPRRIHPFARAVGVVLALPDGHAPLDLLDDAARRVERVAPVRVRGRDRDAHVAERERADAVLDDDVGVPEPLRRFARDLPELARGHRLVRGVLDARHGAAVVDVANGAEEQRRRAVRIGRHLRDERGRVDGARDDRGARHPPATGGMSATSSPARMTSPGEAYSWLSGDQRCGRQRVAQRELLHFASSSRTVAPSAW